MKRKNILILVLLVAMLFPVLYKGISVFAKSSDEIGEDIDNLDDSLQELQSELGDLNSELYTISISIEETQNAIARTQEEMASLNEQLTVAEETADVQYANMKVRIQYMYENTASNSWTTLLMSESLPEFLNRLEYISQIAMRDKELMDAYEATLEEIKTCKEELVEKQDLLAAEEEELESQKALLVAKIDTVNTQIEMTAEEKAKLEEQLELMKQYEEEERKRREEEEKQKTQSQNQGSQTGQSGNSGNANSGNTNSGNANSGSDNSNSGTQTPPATQEPVAPVSPSVGEEELLAALIYCEGGAESYDFQLAVASVVVNRVNSSVYPNNLTDVIYQRGQFSPTWSGRLAIVLERGLTTESCRRAAREALAGNVSGPWIGFRFANGSIQGYQIGNVVFF